MKKVRASPDVPSEPSYHDAWARVHESFRTQDEKRMEELNARIRATEDPDKREPEPPARCVVCDKMFERFGKNHKVCRLCHRRGWSAAACECGRPLQRRDQTTGSRFKGKCAKCRMKLMEEFYPENVRFLKIPCGITTS